MNHLMRSISNQRRLIKEREHNIPTLSATRLKSKADYRGGGWILTSFYPLFFFSFILNTVKLKYMHNLQVLLRVGNIHAGVDLLYPVLKKGGAELTGTIFCC